MDNEHCKFNTWLALTPSILCRGYRSITDCNQAATSLSYHRNKEMVGFNRASV